MKIYSNPYNLSNRDYLKGYLLNSDLLYNISESFTGTTIKIDKQKYSFFDESTPKFIFGLAAKVKKEVTSSIIDIEMLPEITNFLHVEQRAIYQKKNILTAYQYDLANAYTSMLMPFISMETYNKLLKLKSSGFNINKVLGMALLGCKFVNTFKGSVRVDSKPIYNILTPVFKFLYYITCKTFQELCSMLKPIAVCRFVDSAMLTANIEVNELRELFLEALKKSLLYINEKFTKYLKKGIFDIFNLNENKYILNFHKYMCSSITYHTKVRGGLQFYRTGSPEPIFYACSYLLDNKQFKAIT